MSITASNMLPLGTKAPDFELINSVDDRLLDLKSLVGEHGTLIVFMCNHCPYVVYLMEVIVSFSKEIESKGIKTIAISSNSVDTHSQDGPLEMKKIARSKSFSFPYLFDATQEVAHAYQAACTPDFFLFNKVLKLYYRGRFDASRPTNELPINGSDLRFACEGMLKSDPAPEKQYPSMGCNIKWHIGNEPK